MDHRLIEPGSNERCYVLAPEHLPDASPSSAGFAHLGADRLDVIIVLGQKTSQVLKHLDSLENVASHRKLLPQGQRRRHRRLPLLLPLDSDLAFL